MGKNNSIEHLLEEGLGAYGHGNLEKAVESWRLVLELEPSNAMALDYLNSVGVEIDSPEPPDSSEEEYVYTPLSDSSSNSPRELSSPGTLVIRSKGRAEVIGGNVIRLAEHRKPTSLTERIKPLLKEGRYTKALELLYIAKRESPQDLAISKSIQHIKDKYVLTMVGELGALDQRVELTTARNVFDELELDEASRRLVRLIDSETSIGDLISTSMLQKHTALASLSALYSRGLIRLRPSEFSLPSPAKPVTAKPVIETATPETANNKPQAKDTAIVESVTKSVQDDGFDTLFREATLAYVHGDLSNALSLFQKCEALRPGNERVAHNIQRLRSSI